LAACGDDGLVFKPTLCQRIRQREKQRFGLFLEANLVSLPLIWLRPNSGVKLYFNLGQIARMDFFNELYFYQANKYFFQTFHRNNCIYY
jgi:hypothetical protein